MNTSEIKKFATAARKKLIQGVINKISTLGFNAQGKVILEQMPVLAHNDTNFNGRIIPGTNFYYQWMSLYDAIKEKGVKNIYEEVAYTWFNRLVAIRILQKQEQSLITNVLDFVDDSRTPSIVNDARHGIFPEYIDEKTMIELNNLLRDDNKTTEQFAILITAFCHATPMINKIFGRVNDYTELLLPSDILAAGGFVDMLNNSPYITDDDYKHTELIGWLYQFYISERKDEVFDLDEWSAEDIPAGTQIFTPNWIVKYMVENTLGRIYLDSHPDASFKDDLKYLVEPSEGEHPVFEYESLENLRCADFSCGSGHILGEFFDLLYRLYEEEWYDGRTAIENIFKHNLAGIDLDTRAMQLSTFSLMLKACQKDETFKNAECMPHVLDMPSIDFNNVCGIVNKLFKDYNANIRKEVTDAFCLVEKANELGSIMKFSLCEASREALTAVVSEYREYDDTNPEIVKAMELMLMLTDKYSAIAMNPPYMGSKHMDATLKNYVKKNYPKTKTDLFAVFMDVAMDRLSNNAKYGMINMQSWMFLSSFEKLRESILEDQSIDNLLHLGPRTFDELSGEVVQNAAFVMTKKSPSTKGVYYRLVDGKNCSNKERIFLEANSLDKVYYPNISQKNFGKIPGSPISYWLSNAIISTFDLPSFIKFGKGVKGLDSGDNGQFVRNIWEVSNKSPKWVPYCTGGPFRKWYGNNCYVIDLENVLNFKGACVRNKEMYFKEGFEWSRVSSNHFGVRKVKDAVFGGASQMAFLSLGKELNKYLAIYNSKIVEFYIKFLNPTMITQAGDVNRIPICPDFPSEFNTSVDECVQISKLDWDANETSCDFKLNELLSIDEETYIQNINWQVEKYFRETGEQICIDPATPQFDSLEWRVYQYKQKWERMFNKLHTNEEELNRKFIEIYGLADELTPDVQLDDITILQQGEIKIEENEIKWNDDVLIKQFISYAIGVWMGRYRLDRPGLHIAHPSPTEEEIAPYTYNGAKIEIDDDGIVPLMDENTPFPDNAEKRMKEFVEVVFGSSNKAKNIDFINATLGRNTNIAKYLKNDFWKDHLARYQKRPIYWLFQSSRKNPAFQVLVYMHRMDAYTCEKVRTKYLLVYIEHLKNRILYLQGQPTTAAVTRELSQHEVALKECLDYEARLHNIANQQIAFNLDDGVKVNYAKFEDVLAPI